MLLRLGPWTFAKKPISIESIESDVHKHDLRHEESIKVCCRLVHIEFFVLDLDLSNKLLQPLGAGKVPASKPVREGAVWKDLHYTRR